MINWIKTKIKKFKRWIIGLLIPVVMAMGAVPLADSQINPYIELPDRFEFVMAQTLPEAGESRVRISKNAP